MSKEIINELTGYMQIIEQFDKDSAQDAQCLHGYLIQLTNYQARANYLMAFYGKQFREAKKGAYQKLTASSHSQNKYYSPMLARDFVDSCCYESGYIYDLAERLSRLCTHTCDAVRTIVSSLRSERELAKFNY